MKYIKTERAVWVNLILRVYIVGDGVLVVPLGYSLRA